MTVSDPDFDLRRFLPYLLNQAADAASLEFQKTYKARYGMLRTEWRVLFHLGHYGDMTARQICDMGRLHKTKVSRAVAALEKKRFLSRHEMEHDKRHALLTLTRSGMAAFQDLYREAQRFDQSLRADMSAPDYAVLQKVLFRIAGFEAETESKAR